MRAGVAAGHPATAQVGIDVLDAGGTAADAAVAAVLASCVAETLLTGIAGGGYATYYDAASRTVTCLDFFVAVPGLDPGTAAMPMTAVEVNFGAVPVQYAVGGASVAVPGVPAGCGEMHARWGRLPWRSVVIPALRLARRGVALPVAQARTLVSLAPVMLHGDGAAVYAPDGRLLDGGDLLYHPGLDQALALLAEQGPAVFYAGEIGAATVDAVRKAGGALSHTDLAAYRVLEVSVTSADVDGYRVYGRTDLNRTVETIASLPPLAGLAPDKRVVRIADALRDAGQQRRGETTNISVVDSAGNACVVTTTLGVGAGVWLPGLGVHLNSMLGEAELLTAKQGPGQRMASMMCPLVVTERDTLALAAGAAGASRIRTALVHTLVGVLLDGLDPATAIARPRFHVLDGVVHTEPGVPEPELAALAAAGYPIQRWDGLNHYFGGASAVGRTGAGGDPRRGGVGLTR
ncbi:MAG TPA: gamma-glutamyltransferase [Micromonosporaceae bacterium]